MVTFNQAMLAKDRLFSIRVGPYTSKDIKEAIFNYGYIAGDTLKPGGTVAGSAKLIFTSIITKFNKLDKIYPEIALKVDDDYEWVSMGEYFINDITIDRNRHTTELDLIDGMFKLNQPYVSNLTYPAQIRDVIREICTKTGIELETDNLGFRAIRHHIQARPEKKDITFREVLSQAVQLLGFSAFFNRKGKLEVRGLTDSGITITADNYFLHGLTKSEVEYKIAGITCKKGNETLTVGLRTGQSLELENSFMIQNILDDLYHDLKNIKYFPYSLDWQGHLKLDVGQWITLITNKNETYKVPVLSQSFSFKGGLKSRISADSKSGNDTQYAYKGSLLKRIEQVNTDLAAEIQQQIEYVNSEFDKKVTKEVTIIKDEITKAREVAKEHADGIRQAIDGRISALDRQVTINQSNQATQYAEILSKANANTNLATEALNIGNLFRTESLNNIAQIRQLLSEGQTKINTVESEVDRVNNQIRQLVTKTEFNPINQRLINAETSIRTQAGQIEQRLTRTQVENLVDGKGFASVTSLNEVIDTVESHKRTLFDQGKSISQMIQTSSGIVSRVSEITNGQNLVYDPTNYTKYQKRNGNSNLVMTGTNAYKLLRIVSTNNNNSVFGGFKIPLHSQRFLVGEKISYRVNLWVDVIPDGNIGIEIQKDNAIVAGTTIRPTRTGSQIFEGTMTVRQTTYVTDDYGLHIWVEKNGTVAVGQMSVLRGDIPPTSFIDTTSSQQLAIATQVSQLAGSWSVQNLNSYGSLISGINLGADGNNRIDGRATHITGDTLIDNAVIKSAMVDKLKTANFEAGSVTALIIASDAIEARHVKADNALFDKLTSNDILAHKIVSKDVFSTAVKAVTIDASRITTGILTSINGSTKFNLQSGWLEFNQSNIGLKNNFTNRPLQYLVFGSGTINGAEGSYTALLSNRNRLIQMDSTSAGIQIWNARSGSNIQTAVNIYGKIIEFMLSGQDNLSSITINTADRVVWGIEDIVIKGRSLKNVLDNIFNNFRNLDEKGNYNRGYYPNW